MRAELGSIHNICVSKKKVKCSCFTPFQRDYFFLLLEHRKPRIMEIKILALTMSWTEAL